MVDAGDRIERLLESFSASGPLARERAEELVRIVVELYGDGIERILDIMHSAGALSDDLLESLADDELVSGLLLVTGLHPFGVEERILRALDKVRPYMGSHGGDVELLGIDDEGVVSLQLLGSCDGCPSSAVTLELAVETAIYAAAPEATRIDVVEKSSTQTSAQTLISLDSLTSRLRAPGARGAPSAWEGAVTLAELPLGAVKQLTVSGQAMVVFKVGMEAYAYLDSCPACLASLGGAAIERPLGAPTGEAILTCPGCRAHFDVRRAGAGLDLTTGSPHHLQPVPLLLRDGVIELAVVPA